MGFKAYYEKKKSSFPLFSCKSRETAGNLGRNAVQIVWCSKAINTFLNFCKLLISDHVFAVRVRDYVLDQLCTFAVGQNMEVHLK